MNVEEMASRYIFKTERVLRNMIRVQRPTIEEEAVMEVIEEAKRYLEDARFYLERGMSGTSLASVAYAEGLLDSLRMLGLLEFSW
ncbi:MAG: cytidyltransferase-like protein [Candidatus Bathyarchaeota archaeon B26-2]|nr:MAG: cytidyltransferase-like protein [Candidatus Bathyarchaeota archaeon B26-2]